MGDICACVLLSGGFVSSFFLWKEERAFASLCMASLAKASRLDPQCGDRDNFRVFRRRTLSFVGSVTVAIFLLEYMLRHGIAGNSSVGNGAAPRRLLPVKGEVFEFLRDAVVSTVATLALFAGPLMERGTSVLALQRERFVIARDLIICPLGEEVFFRGLILQLLLHQRSFTVAMAISSLLFALSHTHHIFSIAVEAYLENEAEEPKATLQRTCWKQAAAVIVSVYIRSIACGLLTAYHYAAVGSRNVLAAFLTHATCNLVGAPPLDFVRKRSFIRRLVGVATYAGGIIGWFCITTYAKRWHA
ncbi:putative CAAX prenyl protease 2 [Trypanosoma vivax]|nr:putative CAAX prenyl protease 2 [Trypanosoma vivax]